MKEKIRNKRTKNVIAFLLACCIIIGNLTYALPTAAAETKLVEEIGNTPQDFWGNEEWTQYKQDVAAQLQTNETAYYISIDERPLEGYKLYYAKGGGLSSDELLSDTSKYTQIKPLDGFPGVYVFDMTMAEAYSDYLPYGYVRLYDQDETYAINYLKNIDINVDNFNVASQKCGTLELFSVSFEYGEIDAPGLPETGYVVKGAQYCMLESEEDLVDVEGYLFKGWEDSNGTYRGVRYVENVTTTTTVHPIYDNENAAVGEDAWNIFNHLNAKEGYLDWSKVTPVKVTTAEEFAAAITDTTYCYLLVSGDITIDGNTVGGTVNNYTGKMEFEAYGDCIIITDQSSLTFDGVSFDMKERYGNYSMQTRMTVQTGGNLNFINAGISTENLYLAVQKGGTVNIDSSNIEFIDLFNFGSIQVKNTDELSYCGLRENGQKFGNGYGQFFNGEAGLITILAGAFETDGGSYNFWLSQNMNRGTIKAADEGQMDFGGTWVTSNTSSTGEPFYNYGTIQYEGKGALEGNYSDTIIQVGGLQLINYGTINVYPQEDSVEYPSDWRCSEYERYTYFKINGGKIDNYGEINIDAPQYAGMTLYGSYLTDYNGTKYYTCLHNTETGVINVSSDVQDCGIYVSQSCIVDNEGTLNLTNKSNQSVDNTTIILSSGKLLNTGIINNNGCIGFASQNNSYLDSLSYVGDSCRGTGGFAFCYWMSVVNEDYETIFDGIIRKIDNTVVGSEEVFLPAGAALPVSVTATGYMDYGSSISTYATLDEFKTASQTYENTVRCTMQKKQVAKYKVVFNSAGGTAVQTQTVSANGKVSVPKAPTRTGYAFAGWYNGNIKYNFNSKVTKAMTLTAKWTAIKVSKISLSNTSKALQKNQSFTLKAAIAPSNTLNKGVTYVSSNKSVATVTSSGVVKALKIGTATITVTAKDGSNIKATCKVTVGYKIAYKLNGGINNKSNPSSNYNKKITLKNASRKNYKFAGWYADSSFKKKMTSIAKSNTKDITVYAKWKKIKKPAAPTIKGITSKAKTMTITIKKKVSGADGYQITYSLKSSFKNKKKVNTTKISKTIKGLQKGKTYYVKVQAYTLDSAGNKIIGGASKVKTIKIK